MTLHHIGIACKDITGEMEKIAAIHQIVEKSPVIFDPEQNAELLLLTLGDGTRLELIAGEQVATLVKKNITYYHLCFEVEDIYAEIERLTAEGAVLLSPPKPAVLFEYRKVAFLHVSYGIIELLSRK